jgi:hypothetical protein
VHTIHINETDENGNRIANYTSPKEGYSNENGSGSHIYIDLDDTSIEGIDLKTPIVGMAHEEAHAFRFDQGLMAENLKFDPAKEKASEFFITNLIHEDRRRVTEEVEASHIENRVRAELDPTGRTIPLREKYKNIPQNVNPITRKIEVKQIDVNVIRKGYRYYRNKK